MASAPVVDPKLQERLQQATNAAPLESAAQVQGTPDPVASNAFLEKEKPAIAGAIRTIIQNLARQILVARRLQIYRAGRAELYFLGKQQIFWNDWECQWNGVTAGGGVVSADAAEAESFDYTTNFYKGYAESFMTTASQTVPPVPFYPEDPNDREDIEASKGATDASELIARKNDAPMLLAKMAYHGFTGGLMATYTRSVADAQRFGYQVDPATKQKTNIPNEQEVVSIHGALDISLPLWADSQSDADHLCWHMDLPKSKAKATYPWAADQIPSTGSFTDDDLLARLFRVSVRGNIRPTLPSDTMEEMVTLVRVWLRPSTFWYITDEKIRAQLIQMFPNGVCAHYAGGTYCASFAESIDDHWAVELATEGRGMARPGVGDSFVEVQDQINTLSNLYHEYLVYGIPKIYHHSKAINKDAIKSMENKPGLHVPVNMGDVDDVAKLFWQPEATQVPEALISRLDALAGPIGQFLTGIYPATSGATVSGAVQETASGYKMQLQQSMGRVAFFYRRIRSLYQRTMLLAVREFAARRQSDASLATQDPTKKPKVINPLAIRKGNFNIYPEADEGYPAMFSDKRELVQQLMGMAKDVPALQEDLAEPANQELIKTIYGLTDFISAGEDSRLKQLKEIDDMLQIGPEVREQASQGGMLEGVDPDLIARSFPTVQIQPYDRDELELEEMVRWFSSDAGMDAALNNPLGYQNCLAHADMHQQRIRQKAQDNLPPEKPVSPSVTIPADKMPMEAQAQILQKTMGITVTAQDFAVQHAVDIAKTANEKQASGTPPQAANSNGGGNDNGNS